MPLITLNLLLAMKFAMKFKTLAFLLFLLSSPIFLSAQNRLQPHFDEKFRPQLHFSPPVNWMNDPNGMIYHKGVFHLFYQYNPYGDRWGHMSWGHATSQDMLHWEHQPLALLENDSLMAFSGCVVFDASNSSGLGTNSNPPLVALYTGHHREKALQDQRLAYSLDDGQSWNYYPKAVLDEGLADFRDPKVFWHEADQKWVMVLAMPKEHQVRFYSSKNLLEWSFMSEFGPFGAVGGIWECPVLLKVPVLSADGQATGDNRWVLQVDLNPGGPAGGSGAQYFIGDFDGEGFTRMPEHPEEPLWVDAGPDYYAVHSFENYSTDQGEPVWLAWMSNWQYGQTTPTTPWRSAMSIPTRIGLFAFKEGLRLTKQPIPGLNDLRKAAIFGIDSTQISANAPFPVQLTNNESRAWDIEVEIDLKEESTLRFQLSDRPNSTFELRYEGKEHAFFANRMEAGITNFDPNFPNEHRIEYRPELDKQTLSIRLIVDRSSIALFTKDGRISYTAQLFPYEPFTHFSIESDKATQLQHLKVYPLASIWREQP